MSLAESLNWEQEEQYTSVFPRSVTKPEKSGKFKIVREKGTIKENRRYSCRGKMDYLS